MKIANLHLHNEVKCGQLASLITYVTVPVERVSLIYLVTLTRSPNLQTNLASC